MADATRTADGKIYAPWTDAEVAALNRFQASGFVHEFTCVEDHGEKSRVLVAENDGWHCPSCAYVQDWAHAMMLLPPVDPFGSLRAGGFFAGLSDEQKRQALDHRGEEDHGDPAFRSR